MSLGGHARRGIRRGSRAAFALVASFAVGHGALASALPELREGEPVEITADEIIYDIRAKVYVAEGSVRIEQSDQSLEAEWVVFNRETRRGIAAGEVVLLDGAQRVDARFMEFDYLSGQGLMFGGRLDMGSTGFLIGAGEFAKTGDETYTAHDASFTTCRCDDPDDRLPWQLNAEDADIEIGGYATTTNTSVDILGIPTIWLPWMFFPVKNDRETGLLFPELAYSSRNGFEVGIPFFWAARDNVNVTFVPRFMTTTGFKPEVEVEAVYGEKSKTALFGSYVHDWNPRRIVREGEEPPARNVTGQTRWAAGFDNDAHLPLGIRARSDVKLVSDNEYLRDFTEFSRYRRNRYLESTAFAFGHYTDDGSAAFVAGARYADDRQNPDYEDRDQFVLQRFPSVSADWLPSPVLGRHGFTLSLDTDYTYFQPLRRVDDALDLGVADDISASGQFVDIGIGAIPFDDLPARIRDASASELRLIGLDNDRFDEGEPLNDEGHRLVVYPRVARSFGVFGVTVAPEVGWHQTFYTTREQSTAQRGLLTARTDVTSEFVGGLDLPGLGHVEHVLEPRVGWALVQHEGQRNNPLFVPRTRVTQTRLRQQSLDNLVFDDADRIDSANVVTGGFGNRFYGRRGDGRRLLGELNVSFGYDFSEGASGGAQSVILDGQTFFGGGLAAEGILEYGLHDSKIEEALLTVRFPTVESVPFVQELAFTPSYRYRRKIPKFYEFFPSEGSGQFESSVRHINQISGTARVVINDRFTVGYNVTYSLEERSLHRNAGFVEYTSGCRCWAARVDLNGNRGEGPRVNFRVAILGLGNDKGSPFARRGIGASVLD